MPRLTLKPIVTALSLVLPLAVALALPLSSARADEPRTFSSEAEATKACGQDPVVWANKKSKVIHTSTSRWYGKSKNGAFGCKSELEKAGFHATKARTPKPPAPGTGDGNGGAAR